MVYLNQKCTPYSDWKVSICWEHPLSNLDVGDVAHLYMVRLRHRPPFPKLRFNFSKVKTRL